MHGTLSFTRLRWVSLLAVIISSEPPHRGFPPFTIGPTRHSLKIVRVLLTAKKSKLCQHVKCEADQECHASEREEAPSEAAVQSAPLCGERAQAS